MTRRRGSALLFFWALVPILLIPVAAAASWMLDGIALSSVAGQQNSSQAVSDGAGGTLVVWQDNRGGDYDIYVQRLDRTGDAVWTADGVDITALAGDQIDPHVASDGSGGAIVSWTDVSSGNGQIFAQRVDAGGSILWGAGGHPVCVAAGYHSGNSILSDGLHGAYIAWQYGTGTDADIHLQRVGEFGNDLWTTNGVAVCAATDSQFLPHMTTDGAGGVILAWADRRAGSWDVEAARIDPGGTPLWTPDGVLVADANLSLQMSIDLASDGAGGAVFTWWHSGSSAAYVQRISPYGVTMWSGFGPQLLYGVYELPRVIGDGAGGAIVAWEGDASYPDTYNLYAQRFLPGGAQAWGRVGIVVGGADGEQDAPRLALGGEGGVVITWRDNRSVTSYDIYAQRIDVGTGTPSWTTNGVPVSIQTPLQTPSNIVFDGGVGMVIVWTGGDDVGAQRIHALAGDWGAPDPWISAVADVPGDEGGFVHVDWDAGDRDDGTVTYYSLWRAADAAAAEASLRSSAASSRIVDSPAQVGPDFDGTAMYVQTTANGPVYWEWLSNTTATQAASYSVVAPTRRDAVTGDPAIHDFRVVAQTGDPVTFWESAPDSGASQDNLAPAAPLTLTAVRDGNDVALEWMPSGVNEPDLADYVVYRAGAPGVSVEPANLVGSTTGLTLTDTAVPLTALYYVVVSRDVHGNESTPSNEAIIATPTGVGTPALTSLQVGPNVPNPFGASTSFQVGVPGHADASIDVFDVVGRRVRSFARPMSAGWQTFVFDGRDGHGRLLPSGVYFVRVKAARDVVTRKIVIQR